MKGAPMKKINRASELLWIFGILFVALGVSICSKADLGVSMIAAPAFIVAEALAPISDFFSVGVVEYIIQGLMLILLCVVIRRFDWRYLLAFAVAVIYGYTLNFFLWLLSDIRFDEAWLRWVMLIVGDAITSLGVACFFRTYLPLQVYELFVAEIAKRFRFKVEKTKLIFDISLLSLSVLLALLLFGDALSFDWSTVGYTSFHSLGLGTLVTTAINTPLIALMGKAVDMLFGNKARFSKMEGLLKRK